MHSSSSSFSDTVLERHTESLGNLVSSRRSVQQEKSSSRKSTTQENVRERLKQHLRDVVGHEDMDEQEIEIVANLAEVQEWEENEPMRTPAVRVPPPPPSSMSLKRTRADMELVAVVSDPPSSTSVKRARANMELAFVVSEVVTAGIQAFVYLHSCGSRSSTYFG